MFKEPSKEQLEIIAYACERDAETTLHASVINKYSDQKKLKAYFIKDHFVGFVIEEVIFPEAELIQIFVFSEYRGAGFGKGLLKDWIETLQTQGITKVILEVRDGNLPAINIYQSIGFKNVARRKNYYQLNLGTFDALLMDLNLSPNRQS